MLSKSKSRIVVSSLLAVVVGTGCSLIKVNGKTLGGGGSTLTSGSSSPTSGDGAPSTNPADSPEAIARVKAEDARIAGRPAYCHARALSSANVSDLQSWNEQLADFSQKSSGHELGVAAKLFGEARCTTDARIASQQQSIENQRISWMKMHTLDDRDYASLIGLGADGVQPDKIKSGAVAQYNAIAYADVDYGKLDMIVGPLSHLARSATVERMWSLNGTQKAPAVSANTVTSLILLTREPIDAAMAFKEIDAAAGLGDDSRYELRRTAIRASKAVAEGRTALTEAAKADPGVAKLIEIADQAFQQWKKPDAERAAIVKLVESLEAAELSNRRSGYAGCSDSTLAAWTTAVASAKFPEITSNAEFTSYLNPGIATVNGSLAYYAKDLCLSRNGSDRGIFRFKGVKRGPRTTAIANWMNAGGSIVFDDRNMKIESIFRGLMRENWVHYTTTTGIIAAIDTTGDQSKITFKSAKIEQTTCSKWQRTNRIESINASGHIEYEQVCVATGRSMIETASPPVAYDEMLVRNLKPGMVLFFAPQMPIAATASASSKTLVYVLGASIK